jgi:hypothetical protein
MARVALVRVNSTVGAVCAAAGFLMGHNQDALVDKGDAGMTYRSLLNNDVLDDEFFDINALCISVGLGIFQ